MLVESAHPGRMQWIVAAVVLAAAIAAGLLWWFGATSPRQLAQNVSAPVSGPVSSPVTDARINTEVSPGTAVQPAERNDLLPRLKLAVSIPPRREDASVAHAGGAKDKSASAKPGSRIQEDVAAHSPVQQKGAATATVGYGDLPASVRQNMPSLAINGFASGDGGAAMVVVDDKLLREGDEAAPGVRVERILSDGVEFSYRGYRFRR
ncbi:MAG TPA: general secretion pathway protein GspB [Rhodocyclaceae bacterium]|nr:general secretion pathway protein GspB [Rhodocyclaceae bacterium]HNC60009.1 general secretion pathway protein GspB [Rhodocyclaceae bacterium]HNH11645.1 general secretion pathway protein GspB [Rhodocyclaceae bacterium]HNH98026.1 general secretion pathway protein GspB [Rhodocyclaceae bacterium]